ncbi:hypothetical protein FBFR_00415 [Flavobacterium fryxellicola]|uniref:Uncharacterized protein n=1 Tax=Flavobacterium fryxellicola TaxID=249352 RepID=A0A168ACC5_9FLAO|nr:hypothetical protein FBFR_00415 [Flavobacterium fryxellicola]
MVFHLLSFVFLGSNAIRIHYFLNNHNFLILLPSFYIDYSKILTLKETDVNYTIKFSDKSFYD